MPFNMGFSHESLSGKPPVPAGWYKLRLIKFKPAASKGKDSINLNPELEVIDNLEHDGRKVFETLNTKGAWVIQDLVHACGMQMVEIQDGNQGTEAASYTMPGIWDKSDQFPEEPEKWEYQGPLTNAVFEAELYLHEYNGKKSNKVKQFKCAIPGCTERHSTNLSGS
jgi:hypothetical protein